MTYIEKSVYVWVSVCVLTHKHDNHPSVCVSYTNGYASLTQWETLIFLAWAELRPVEFWNCVCKHRSHVRAHTHTHTKYTFTESSNLGFRNSLVYGCIYRFLLFKFLKIPRWSWLFPIRVLIWGYVQLVNLEIRYSLCLFLWNCFFTTGCHDEYTTVTLSILTRVITMDTVLLGVHFDLRLAQNRLQFAHRITRYCNIQTPGYWTHTHTHTWS